MLKYLLIALLTLNFALPAMAEQTLSPMEVESLPFNSSSDAIVNTNAQLVPATSHDNNHETGAHGSESKAGLPQFDTSSFASQIFWLAITFIIMYLALAKIFLPRLSKVMDDRQLTIKSDLNMADRLSQDVEKTRAAYEQQLEKAHAQSRATLTKIEEELRDKAVADSAAFKEKSDQQAATIEAKAQKAKDALKDDLNDIAQTLTANVVEKLSLLKISDALISETIKEKMDGKNAPVKKKKAA